MTNPALEPEWAAIKELTEIVELQQDAINNLVASVGLLVLRVELLENGKENDGDHSGPVTPEAPAS